MTSSTKPRPAPLTLDSTDSPHLTNSDSYSYCDPAKKSSPTTSPQKLKPSPTRIYDDDIDEDAAFHGRRRRRVSRFQHSDHAYLTSLVDPTSETTVKQVPQHRIFCAPLPDLGDGYRYLREAEAESRRNIGMADTEAEAAAGAAVVAAANMIPEDFEESPSEMSYSKSSTTSRHSAESLSEFERDSKSTTSTHFEDLSLADGERSSLDDCNVKADERPTLKRRPRSSTPGDMNKSATNLPLSPLSPRMPPFPDNGRYPGLKGSNGALREQSLNLPAGRGMRRGFTSPGPVSAPFMMHSAVRNGYSSRSPSPGGRSVSSNGTVNPPQSTTPRASWEARARQQPGPLSRRSSLQPGKKTVAELEAEYNDEDDDVPVEAILENVPVSPMPGQTMHHQNFRVKTPSPHRRTSHNNLHGAHGNLHSANVPKNARRPSAPTLGPNGRFVPPRRSRPSMLPHSASMTNFQAPEPLSHKHRSQSWSEDLNEEARQLSLALEEYADRKSTEKRHSGQSTTTTSNPTTPPRPNLGKLRAKTSILELAPMQKGSIMIDPLPISKEKEAVLTRTRPSWLPPKCQKEERKHMKEWEQMMARAGEAEKKRVSREKEMSETKEEMQGSIARIWDQHVLPNWDQVINEPRTRELWWRGVTPRSRAQVWRKAIGNELSLTPASFEAALRRAHELEETVAEMPDEDRPQSTEAAWLAAITRDVPAVLPSQQIFQPEGPLHQTLTDVLKAYAMYRRDVGYVYGTHLVAGTLCLHLRAPEAFIALANLLNRPLPLAFLVHDTAAMQKAYTLVLGTLKYKSPSLHSHLTSATLGLSPAEIMDPLFRCLFARNLPPEHVSRVWDLVVFEGDRALIRAAVAVLGKLEHRLYGDRKAVLDVLGWANTNAWDVGNEEDFIKAIREAGKVDGTTVRNGSQ